ncbi:Arylsulfatase A [Halomicrobium sp. LC1Hm]|nr:sulfatase-like hydrolase/transferase [Halomicrobium sp. LC1Hm]QGA84165.1 Arylsulfatase A [Halomicrobium sp. LC1Hm]
MNIAIIVLDTLRKDAFDEHFDWLPGTRFDNAWSPGAWTTPVHASLFGGAYPGELGVYAKTETLDCDRATLAELLSEAGYTTRGFSANANISSAFNFDRGFSEFGHSWRGTKYKDHIFDWGNFVSKTQDQGPSRYFEAVYRCLTEDVDTLASLGYGARMKARDLGIEWISGTDDGAGLALERVRNTDFGDDEFLFMNLMEAHGPYTPPEEYQTTGYTESPSIGDTIGEGPVETEATIRQAYNDSVRYLSDIYSDIFTELRRDFDYIFTLGDHGELFGKDGAWAHNHGIYPELVNVPLSVYTGEDGVSRRDDLASLLDVHQTVLDAAGIDAPSRGVNLFEPLPERDLVVERYGLRTNRIEQMSASDYDQETIDRYDTHLFGVVVPERYYGYETLDGFKERELSPAGVDLCDRLDAARDALPTASVSFDEGSVPADVQDRLEELGYA